MSDREWKEEDDGPPWRGRGLSRRLRRGTRLWGFVLPASLHRLEQLCQRHLNRDPGGHIGYLPLAPLVLLTFAATDLPIGKRAPVRRLRRSVECEAALWVAVRRRGAIAPLMFAPYVFTNDPLEAVEGRELYGLPKEIAFLRQTDWPRRFAVQGYVIDRMHPKAVGHWGDILSVRQLEAGHSSARRWPDIGSATRDLHAVLRERSSLPISSILDNFWPPHGMLVQLKQFPDCADSRYSCYSAIVEAQSRVTHVADGGLLDGEYELSIADVASHPLTEDLGLQDGSRALLAYEMHCNVELVGAREVLRAAVPPLPSLSWPSSVVQSMAAVPQRILDFGAHALRQLAEAVMPPPLNEQEILLPNPPPRPKRRENIAILGGGVGAVAAAFALTSEESWQERYKITVYQAGWRLTGSGLNPSAAPQHPKDHGPYSWAGFHENSTRMMRQCLDALPSGDDTARAPIQWDLTAPNEAPSEERHGLGAAVFAPLYRLLRQRGVKFKFFHRVRQLRLTPDRRAIAAIVVGRQATPTRDYPYLRRVDGVWCWPQEPSLDHLRDGEVLRELKERDGSYVDLESAQSTWGTQYEDRSELRLGAQFDRVVLGISRHALPDVSRDLADASPLWRKMVESIGAEALPSALAARHRLRSDESGFDNLYLAGDWTFNGLNIASVEAAVMSGMRAAQAILGRSLSIAGESHLDHTAGLAGPVAVAESSLRTSRSRRRAPQRASTKET